MRFPSFNVQLVVDAKRKSCEFEIRAGSAYDLQIFNNSKFGNSIDSLLPENGHIVSDAGYGLSETVMTPFTITNPMPPNERNYEYLISRTRIVVEYTIGLLKSRF
jgi:DDE superfamily endonuclease